MSLTPNDKQELKNEFDERYVLQDDCVETQKDITKKFANDDKRIEVLIESIKPVKWTLTTIAAAVIGILIKMFLGG